MIYLTTARATRAVSVRRPHERHFYILLTPRALGGRGARGRRAVSLSASHGPPRGADSHLSAAIEAIWRTPVTHSLVLPCFSQKINVQGPTFAPPIALWYSARLLLRGSPFRAHVAASIALLSSPRKARPASPTRPTTRTNHMTTQRHCQWPSPTSDARLAAAVQPRQEEGRGPTETGLRRGRESLSALPPPH